MQVKSGYTCPFCNNPVSTASNFCPNCGTRLSLNPAATINLSRNISQHEHLVYRQVSNERNIAAGCHIATLLGWLLPFLDLIVTIAIYMHYKDVSPFVAQHAKEALHYQITFYICTIIAVGLSWLLIGIPILLLLMLIDITVPIYMGIKANNGNIVKYPLILRFL